MIFIFWEWDLSKMVKVIGQCLSLFSHLPVGVSFVKTGVSSSPYLRGLLWSVCVTVFHWSSIKFSHVWFNSLSQLSLNHSSFSLLHVLKFVTLAVVPSATLSREWLSHPSVHLGWSQLSVHFITNTLALPAFPTLSQKRQTYPNAFLKSTLTLCIVWLLSPPILWTDLSQVV